MLGGNSFIFPPPPKGTQNMELKSGMVKPEEFCSSVLVVVEVLVI